MKTVAKILLINSQGQILVLQRGLTHPHFPGHFDLPGGEAEPGEELEQTVAREVVEESGLNIDPNTIRLLYEKQIDPTTRHLLYLARLDADSHDITLSWEHSNYSWLTPNEILLEPIPRGIDSYFVGILEYLKNNNI